jgi:hypothetical protein
MKTELKVLVGLVNIGLVALLFMVVVEGSQLALIALLVPPMLFWLPRLSCSYIYHTQPLSSLSPFSTTL